jgi:hypothetical protein
VPNSSSLGDEFERETARLAGDYGRRVVMSGAIGTTQGYDVLCGDANWKLPWMEGKLISIECKHGYGDSDKKAPKSLRMQKEWFDKHEAQAKTSGFLPMWAMKFKFANNGKFLIIPFSTMSVMLDKADNNYKELIELREEVKKLNGSKNKN